MYATYEDACEATISHKRAKYSVEVEHGHTDGMAEFIAENGEHDSYAGQDILDWLGY